jgi:hypothetical protein
MMREQRKEKKVVTSFEWTVAERNKLKASGVPLNRALHEGIELWLKKHSGGTNESLNGFPHWFVEKDVDKVELFDYIKKLAKGPRKIEDKRSIVKYLYDHFVSLQSYINTLTNPESIFYIPLVAETLGDVYKYTDLASELQKTQTELRSTQKQLNEKIEEKEGILKQLASDISTKKEEKQKLEKECVLIQQKAQELELKTPKGMKRITDKLDKYLQEFRLNRIDKVYYTDIDTYQALRDTLDKAILQLNNENKN